ncbi:MAG: tRNA 4-thiouridine(8) synthase ThiI [Spirochaetaceae bacterium]|nr:tRNA 4-thiouridine(8) synthase ThiI [Spirochaetaceae bacterium]
MKQPETASETGRRRRSKDVLTYLLKLGELTLKGNNRQMFEQALKRNALALLRGTGASVKTARGRFFVYCGEDAREQVEDALSRLFGIAGWALAQVVEKTPEAVVAACAEAAANLPSEIQTFKIEARRTDKSFPLDSYAIRREGGSAALAVSPRLKVDVHAPQALISVEIREKAYVYPASHAGLRGLPVGTAGRGLALLSGGIDSPVACFLMASRGLRLDALYFHAYPYTSEEARQKVIRLARIVGRYTMGMRLFVLSFTEIQRRIQENAPERWLTVLSRMAMMECAEALGRARGASCLITGESLSQVASQTVKNIDCVQSAVTLPVLRPLIGMDKEAIIRLAERIGTYETSILPYGDCCAVFSPAHPVLRGDRTEAARLYAGLNLAEPIKTALMRTEQET